MNIELLIAYTITAFFYITSPGPAVLLAVSNGLTSGMKAVYISSLANITGLAVLSIASILGLGLILKTSAVLFLILKVIGAIYFIYLGIKFIRQNKAISFDENHIDKTKKSPAAYFREAFFIAVTNPKPILFFTAIFPQFLDTDKALWPQFTLMTLIFLLISFGSLCCYGYLSGKSKRWLNNTSALRWVNRITGGLFILLGLGLLKLKPAQ